MNFNFGGNDPNMYGYAPYGPYGLPYQVAPAPGSMPPQPYGYYPAGTMAPVPAVFLGSRYSVSDADGTYAAPVQVMPPVPQFDDHLTPVRPLSAASKSSKASGRELRFERVASSKPGVHKFQNEMMTVEVKMPKKKRRTRNA